MIVHEQILLPSVEIPHVYSTGHGSVSQLCVQYPGLGR
jgi:hypothetical protein